VETAAKASRQLGLPAADAADLAGAYTDVFILNVYPYGTTFTDPYGELNGPEAQHLAVEREPAVHPFYRSLAKRRREWLLAEDRWPTDATPGDDQSSLGLPLSADEAVSLRHLVRFLLAPAQWGIFRSRDRLWQMAMAFEMRLPFGSRFEVAETLLLSAGEAGRSEQLVAALEAEIDRWRTDYARRVDGKPKWQAAAEMWLGRIARTMGQLKETRQMVAAQLS
jgi:hypothetical protein